ncbi:cytohesin-1-like [Sycon ciliatum]|uniref:cytohesin-1-like n=1 Tax=Sycon ciliatum TaxID=27933 RepID=UPI0031F63C41
MDGMTPKASTRSESTQGLSDFSEEEQSLLDEIGRKKSKLQEEIQHIKNEIAEVTAELETMDGVVDVPKQQDQKTKQLATGRKRFNMDPQKGLNFLYMHGLLNETPEDVAGFLYRGEGLSKKMIGEYLGKLKDFNVTCLKEFVKLHDFTNMSLVSSLRQFLWNFRLPGEAQQIDRMMEAFAKHYCQHGNGGVFANPDTCYVMSFSIIMLNTSLHNVNVKTKMTIEGFISQNRGINDGDDLPEELLRAFYEDIKKDEFKIPEDEGGSDLTHTFFNPDREGWLTKEGGKRKTWRRRWFILTENCLFYFKLPSDKEPRGIIPLENLGVRELADNKRPQCFEIFSDASSAIKACKTDSEGKVVEGHHNVYRIQAATAEEKDEWIKCIRASISRDPFYEMLQTRKKKATHQQEVGV